jgi:phthiocerol/phenolphthiocerol synthesis type-I polyketide synthase D
VPIVAFRPAESTAPEALGWARFTSGTIEVVKVPGDHVTFLAEPRVREVAGSLSARLGQPAVTRT